MFLGELYWARYAALREEPEAGRHLDALIEALKAVQVADADPLVFPDAVMTGIYVNDPWFPWVSSIWARKVSNCSAVKRSPSLAP